MLSSRRFASLGQVEPPFSIIDADDRKDEEGEGENDNEHEISHSFIQELLRNRTEGC